MSVSEKNNIQREPCKLQKARGIDAWCTREECIYWRLLEPQDVDGLEVKHISNSMGCGLQHYDIISGLTPEMADWLLSMKKRLENTTPESAKARITFRHREEE
jgi:hypothetical protein